MRSCLVEGAAEGSCHCMPRAPPGSPIPRPTGASRNLLPLARPSQECHRRRRPGIGWSTTCSGRSGPTNSEACSGPRSARRCAHIIRRPRTTSPSRPTVPSSLGSSACVRVVWRASPERSCGLVVTRHSGQIMVFSLARYSGSIEPGFDRQGRRRRNADRVGRAINEAQPLQRHSRRFLCPLREKDDMLCCFVRYRRDVDSSPDLARRVVPMSATFRQLPSSARGSRRSG